MVIENVTLLRFNCFYDNYVAYYDDYTHFFKSNKIIELHLAKDTYSFLLKEIERIGRFISYGPNSILVKKIKYNKVIFNIDIAAGLTEILKDVIKFDEIEDYILPIFGEHTVNFYLHLTKEKQVEKTVDIFKSWDSYAFYSPQITNLYWQETLGGSGTAH